MAVKGSITKSPSIPIFQRGKKALNLNSHARRKRARFFTWTFLCVFLAVFFFAWKGPSGAATVKLIRSAPAFEVTTLDGKVFSLRAMKGHPVVINFWASWCPPCRTEAQGIQRAYAAFKGSGVRFIGIAVQDEPQDVKKFIKEFNWGFPVSIDEKEELMNAYSVYGMPKTIVVDRYGVIAYERLGAISEEDLTAEIRKVLLK
mgnify:CR=1 FL=1